MPVTVVTDSTSYLPREQLDAEGVRVVSLYVNERSGTSREGDMPDFDAFYERLRSSNDLPTTSQPSIGDFLAVYEPLLAAGHDIVSLHISGGISGTVESARQAAAEAANSGSARRIEVIDTRSTAGGMAGMVLAAAAAARAGGDVDAVLARAQDAVATCRIWFAVDTLEYLKRGGRIGAAQAWFGGALKIKPILTLDGEVTPVERVRTSGRAFERLVEYAETMKEQGLDGWMVQHIQHPDGAAELVERVREVFGGTDPLTVSEIGPVIGTHAGPGLLGVGGLPRRLVD